ncbi:hypothetical protein B224_4688 [Aeromonas media WS]|nr:hypothetical protein B224_4688 [Aeromonas media WS]
MFAPQTLSTVLLAAVLKDGSSIVNGLIWKSSRSSSAS